ncbi:hypothetical protein RND59_17345 [Vibrio ruber]|uniref:hypothetical protein n=1 Tax=Vibrio ruber TaxID=184755 RepID=UPI002893283E|nr:hypothetical protein [Vibrio ruber]WNJ97888.1 hypothetical protein RND59_17345 [Vibrio ruber]
MSKNYWEFIQKTRKGMPWSSLENSGLQHDPYIKNKDYESIKFSNILCGNYKYYCVLFFYQKKLTHIHVYSSSDNANEQDALNYWKNNFGMKMNWNQCDILDDKKSGYKYIIIS